MIITTNLSTLLHLYFFDVLCFSRTKQLPTDPRVEDEEDNAEEEKSDQMPDVFADVTLAVDHLQLTTSNEKTAKSHGFKVGARIPK